MSKNWDKKGYLFEDLTISIYNDYKKGFNTFRFDAYLEIRTVNFADEVKNAMLGRAAEIISEELKLEKGASVK